MMKYIHILCIGLLLSMTTTAQIVKPIHWSWRAERTGANEYNLVFTALLDHPWHTYGMYIGEGGPVATHFAFDKNADIELVGKMTEAGPKVHEGMDDVFGINVKSFEEKAVFTQHIKLKKPTTVKGNVESMCCDDKSCLPPETISFSLDAGKDVKDKDAKEDVKKKGSDAIEIAKPNTTTASTPPTDTPKVAVPTTMTGYYQGFFNKAKYGTPILSCGEKEEPITTWLAFILGFGGGLLALLTPCVFPMIPLTVSFFTKRSEDKTKGKFESIFYGFCILFIFFLLSMPFLFFNLSSNTLNAISTNLWLNLFFFVIFLIFAFSFFGYYEIALPSSLATKIDTASNVGGLVGIFFMALTLVIVSFSCTGPILGTLLGSMATAPNGRLNLVVGMTSFGLAMGLPFTLFALFPNLLKSLPKSGGWMDSLKKILGFVELILAIKFLSNADLAGHWGILKREIFLALWAIFGIGLFLYLMGIIRFSDDSPIKRSAPVRLILMGLAIAFTVYSGYGAFGRDLPLFSGFAPPNYYSIFPKKTQCPDDLSCFHDYDEGIAYAKLHNKPVLLDFTGYNCANCRKMEESIWTNPDVYARLSAKYVIISLYVDDYQRSLPDSMHYAHPTTGERRSSYGHKWSDLQTVCFGTNTQPEYVLVSNGERLLNNPWKGYDPDATKFKAFLDCGLDADKTLVGR